VPLSLLTSDTWLEWFHSNIAGGEDPFARKVYGLDQAYIRYQDEEGRTMEINRGQLTWSGIDLVYYYYPDFKALKKHKVYTNFGIQLGENVNPFNPSIDLGINASLIKKVDLKNSRELRMGLSLSALDRNIFELGNGVQISNKKLWLSTELLLNYLIPTLRTGYFSLAISYFLQSSYNLRADFDTLVLTGDRITSHWHYSISHLYRILSANYLIVTYSRGALAYSMFLREDFSVDNAPDAQVGLGINVRFK
jgi:hypothetical protein